jgi:hypothetical protein
MRDLERLDWSRVAVDERGDDGGAFRVASPIDRQPMVVIASFGAGWDHVSVSRKNRVPNWAEMEFVKRLFFEDHETAVQFHVPSSDHVNMHPNVLHLWRPNDGREMPRPPSILVGVGDRPARDEADAAAMMRAAGLGSALAVRRALEGQ